MQVLYVDIYTQYKTSGGMLCYTVRVSVCPSVTTSYPISNFSISDEFSSNFAWVLVSGTFGLGVHMI